MKLNLSDYAGMNVCVAVSGGRDSMALLHYLKTHAAEYSIRLSALNCDHGLRGFSSARDSAFVAKWCGDNGIPLQTFKADCRKLSAQRRVSIETAARDWRLFCYYLASGSAGQAVIATAHHLDDNAETVLFNIARGSAISGATGLKDGEINLRVGMRENAPCAPWECDGENLSTVGLKIIRPLIEVTRGEIDEYIKENGVPYVDDATNFTDEYTRNKLRLNVLPELEKAVPGANKNLFRFSRMAQLTDDFIAREAAERVTTAYDGNAALIGRCDEFVLFSHCAVSAVKDWFRRKDYTAAHVQALYELQYAKCGTKYEFLNLVAYSENGRIAICERAEYCEQPFGKFDGIFAGRRLLITDDPNVLPIKPTNDGVYYTTADGDKFKCKFPLLKFDLQSIPAGAVIRTRRDGDRFEKFGGGAKSLGDFFTDRKIPLRLRDELPLIAVDNEILAVCGVEISEKIKVTPKTLNTAFIVCGAII